MSNEHAIPHHQHRIFLVTVYIEQLCETGFLCACEMKIERYILSSFFLFFCFESAIDYGGNVLVLRAEVRYSSMLSHSDLGDCGLHSCPLVSHWCMSMRAPWLC